MIKISRKEITDYIERLMIEHAKDSIVISDDEIKELAVIITKEGLHPCWECGYIRELGRSKISVCSEKRSMSWRSGKTIPDINMCPGWCPKRDVEIGD